MSYKQRQALNRAVEDAHEDAPDLRKNYINRLEALREIIDVSPKEINNALDKQENWYSNNIHGDRSGHDFNLYSFCEVKVFLEMSVLYSYQSGRLDEDDIRGLVDEDALDEELAASVLET